MLKLKNIILFISVRIGSVVHNTRPIKESGERLKLTAPITLQNFYFVICLNFSLSFKLKKILISRCFGFKKVNPYVYRKIISKMDTI